jgi:glycosyltransferase involved in cell wall biosynthesis
MVEVDVVLPVLDEVEAIPRVLGRLPRHYRAIVVDNGSTDGSASVARDLGAIVVSEPRRGFGSACYAGLCAATGSVVAFMDCDGSLDASDLPKVCEPVVRGDADLVMGRRVGGRAAWPAHARIANRVLAARVRRATGVAIRDLGPMRAADRRRLVDLQIADRRSGWPLEMVLRAANARWQIDEVDVEYSPRVGRSKVTGTLRGTAQAIDDMQRVLRELT